MLNKNLVTLWSISLLALIVCSCENAGASIDPPALAENNSSSSSKELPIEDASSSSNIKIVEKSSFITKDNIELTIVKTQYFYAADTENNGIPSVSSSSSADELVNKPTNNVANEKSSAYATCTNSSKTYSAKFTFSSNYDIEKNLNLNEAGSYCNTIFETFKTQCPADLEIENGESGCDSQGSVKAKCVYNDVMASFDELLSELTDEVTYNCDKMSGASTLLRYNKK